jgi:cellobiose-specific phosphotransferase system component IIC
MEFGETIAQAFSDLFPWFVGFLLVVLIVGFIARIFTEEQMKLLDWFLLFLGLSVALYALR